MKYPNSNLHQLKSKAPSLIWVVWVGISEMPRYTFVDIFCGAGGSSLGFLRAGFEPVGAIDNYLPAINTYETNIGIKPIMADASRFDFAVWTRELGDVDVIVSCPPCQGFSRLRRNLVGSYDKRNRLVNVLLKAVKNLKPRAVVLENVPGIVSSNIFKRFLSSIEKLGYHASFSILEAADYGVPQRRRRLILVATRNRKLVDFPPEPTHERGGNNGLPPWRTVRGSIADLPPLKPGEIHPSIPNHACKNLPENWLQLIRAIPKDGGSRHQAPRKLLLPAHRKLKSGFCDVFGRLRWDAPSNTITTGCWDPSRGRFVHPEQDRGLSLRECARLQGFPDDFVFKGSLSSIARQIGEALPPQLAYTVAKSIRYNLP